MEDQKKHWGEVAKLGALASVIDPNDTVGHKNRYIVAIRDQALMSVLPRGSARILDFGCGSGNLSRAMASKERQFVGVDITAELIALAEEQNDPTFTRFILYDGGRIPLDNNSMDAAATYVVLNHITDDDQLIRSLKEVARVLKPHARMYCIEQTRRTTTTTQGGLKKQRSVEDFAKVFTAAGMRVTTVRHLRKARFLGTYAVRYGLVPKFALGTLARVDGLLASLFPRPRSSYVDTLFTLEQNQA